MSLDTQSQEAFRERPRDNQRVQRRRWILTGVVQGVGFRPHVARIAERFAGEMTGFCGNDALSVFIEAQGPPEVLHRFITAVVEELPPLASVLSVRETEIDVVDAIPVANEGKISSSSGEVEQQAKGTREGQETGFRIVASEGGEGARTLIPPDVAMCKDCLSDIMDPHDRRSGYAFTTCTNCGPRMSIIEDLPYDRPNTTMRDFPLCDACAKEYRDPHDRRFHAQPISCYDCGPHLWMVRAEEISPQAFDLFDDTALPVDLVDGSRGGRAPREQDEVLDSVAAEIRRGAIVAVKGIGGFHLLVDATNEAAVARLRLRKQRDGKPFALMVPTLEAARRLIQLGAAGGEGERLLTSPAHPIVLAPRLETCKAKGGGARENAEGVLRVAASVAPGLPTLGVMIAYTPLHRLLLQRVEVPVVATSGNLSSEPLCYDNADALKRLGGIADVFLLHNRQIAVPVEDSVVMLEVAAQGPIPPEVTQQTGVTRHSNITRHSSVTQQTGVNGTFELLNAGARPSETGWESVPVRRSRGYVPIPLLLPEPPFVQSQRCPQAAQRVVLGVGGELKNTFTLVRNGMAFTSAHIGDMGSLASQQAYSAAITQLTKIHGEQPAVLIRDLHPNYATTAWAERYARKAEEEGRKVEVLALQHHLAHAYSLLAETGVGSAIVWSVDGTGYGVDKKIWGSELFYVDIAQISLPSPHGGAVPNDSGLAGAKRLAHLPYFQLPGADLAIREPWRQAVSLLQAVGLDASGLPLQERLNTDLGKAVLSQLETKTSPSSCALGRYFDAAAAILGLSLISTYEAQAPLALQFLAQRWGAENPSPAQDLRAAAARCAGESGIKTGELPVEEVFRELVTGMRRGEDPGFLAYRFHAHVAAILAGAALDATKKHGCNIVGITGGSALNPLLRHLIGREIRRAGKTWLTHSRIPPNDGGLSLGQAYFGYLLSASRTSQSSRAGESAS